MIIIYETKLYPVYDEIVAGIKAKTRFNDSKRYSPYVKEVLFPIPAYSKANYYPVAHYAAMYGAEDTFKSLLNFSTFDPYATDLLQSFSLLQLILLMILNQKILNKTPYQRELNALFARYPKLDTSIGILLINQSPLCALAENGDEHFDLVKKIAGENPDLSCDLTETSPFMSSLQEAQYQTTNYLLDVAGSKALVMQRRFQDTTALDLAITYSTDLEKGQLLIKRMIAFVDPAFIREESLLFSVVLNNNPQCVVAYTHLLLASGADPNLINQWGMRLLVSIFDKYQAEKQRKNEAMQAALLQMISICLKQGAECDFVAPGQNKNFIRIIAESGDQALQDTFRDQIQARQQQTGVSAEEILVNLDRHEIEESEEVIKKNHSHRKFIEKITTIGMLENEVLKQNLLFQLKEQYASDWKKDASGDFETMCRVHSILSNLVDLFRRAALTKDNILKLIEIYHSVKNPGNKVFVFLYRGYFSEFLLHCNEADLTDEEISQLFLNLNEYAKSLSVIFHEDKECLKEEFDAISQRCMLLILGHIKKLKGGLAQYIRHISVIDEDLWGEQSKFLILQLKINHAYFSGNLNTLNILLNEFPSGHILARQYAYWQAELLFKQAAPEVLDQKFIDAVTLAMDRLDQYPDIPVEHVLDFRKKKNAYCKAWDTLRAAQKKLKQRAAPPPISAPSTAPAAANNNNIQNNTASSSSVSTSHLVLPAARKILPAVQDVTDPVPAKEKRKHTLTLQIQALDQLARDVDPNRKKPLYTEAEIREYFKNILQPTDTLKSLSYDHEEGMCWAVCRTADIENKILAKQFNNKFAESYKLKLGWLSSGICYEKNKITDEGEFRLKLGHHDERMHATAFRFKAEGDERALRCFLLVFDMLWDHKAGFEQCEVYLDPPRKTLNNSNNNQ